MRRISPFVPACALAVALPLGAQSPRPGVRSVRPWVTVSKFVPGPSALLERELREQVLEAVRAAGLNRGDGYQAELSVSVEVEDSPACPGVIAVRTSFALKERATVVRGADEVTPVVTTWQHDLMALVPADEAIDTAKDQARRLTSVLLVEIAEQNRAAARD